MQDSITSIVQVLNGKEVITQKNVGDLRRFIKIKNPDDSEENNAMIFADAFKKILHIKLSVINKKYRDEITKILLKNTINKPSFGINAQDVFEACLKVDTDEEVFYDEFAQWSANILEKPIVKGIIKSYALELKNSENSHKNDDDFYKITEDTSENAYEEIVILKDEFIESKDDTNEIELLEAFKEENMQENDLDKARQVAIQDSLYENFSSDNHCAKDPINMLGILLRRLDNLYKYLFLNKVSMLLKYLNQNKSLLGKCENIRIYGMTIVVIFTTLMLYGNNNIRNMVVSKSDEVSNINAVSALSAVENSVPVDLDKGYFPYKAIPKADIAPENKEKPDNPELFAFNSENRSDSKEKSISRSIKDTTIPPKLGKFKKKIVMKATAYDLSVESCSKTIDHPQYGITYSGARATFGRTVAVDPLVIPIRSKLYIEFPEKYKSMTGVYVAEDVGSLIKGEEVDIFFGEDKPGERIVYGKAREFGVQKVTVYLLE